MLLLYYGTGSRSLELGGQSMSEDEQHELFINVSSALKSRGHKRALEYFESIPFSVWDGTNDFNDEFALLYAEVPLIKYDEIRAVYNYPEVKYAFRHLAETITEIGSYIRFIAIELLRSKADEWDVFICHASKDKEAVARPLGDFLESYGLRVWLDENELTLGDSLRGTIDDALTKSNYGIVILSKAFFERDWPQRELNALAALESRERKVIIPVWHEVNHGFIAKFSPLLADKFAVSTENGLVQVVTQILKAIQPNIKYFPENKPPLEISTEPPTGDRIKSIRGIILGETIAIKEKAQRYLDGNSTIEELQASTPMLTSIASELRYLTPDQIIAYRRAVTLDMEMRETGKKEKLLSAIEACDEVIRLLK